MAVAENTRAEQDRRYFDQSRSGSRAWAAIYAISAITNILRAGARADEPKDGSTILSSFAVGGLVEAVDLLVYEVIGVELDQLQSDR